MATTGFAHPEFLIDTEALERQLGDPDLRVFDCTTNLIPDTKTTYQAVPGRADFEKGHIPGAQFIDLQADLSDHGLRLRFMAPSAEEFAAAMRRFGVGEGSRVVLYSTGSPWWATRVWWLLRVFGFDGAAVLDGGWQKWRREGRPLETGPAKPRAEGDFAVRQPRPLMVGRDEVLRAIGDGAVCTLNALAPEQHAGRRQPLWAAGPDQGQRQFAGGAFDRSGDQCVSAGGRAAPPVRGGRRL
jgi:thiosulfate/3-mercaptopyruvate sulfurtransferase